MMIFMMLDVMLDMYDDADDETMMTMTIIWFMKMAISGWPTMMDHGDVHDEESAKSSKRIKG